MIHHLLRRLAGMALVLLAVTFVTFVALAAAPGDAAGAMVGDSASAEQMALLRQSLGLEAPLLARYQRFLGDLLLHGDLGRSLVSGRPVSQLLLERLPHTALLAVSAIGLAVLLGAPLGMVAALRAGTRLETALMGGAALGLAVPTFWSGLLLMLLFSLRLRWLPVAGAGSLRHLVLPAVVLALPTAAIVARLLRASLLDTLHADFVRTAHGKGLSSQRVFAGHVLRNSLLPVVTILGLQLGHLLGGAFVVETIFGWPGVGRLAVQAIFDRDTPVVLGAVITIAAGYLLINLAVDLMHGALDPRVGRATV